MRTRTDNRTLYRLLVVILLFAEAYQIAYSISAIEQRRRYDRIERPFSMSVDTDRFANVDTGAAAVGIQKGDQLVEIEGKAYTGGAQLARIFEAKRPGDTLTLKVRRKEKAAVETISVPLRVWSAGALPVTGWIVFAALTVFTPVSCLLLGFFVAAARPRDPLAWLLLALMLSFAQMSTTGFSSLTSLMEWPGALRPASVFYHTFFSNTWSIWILLFGIYFPERLALDRRMPWLKWVFIAPIGLSALGNAIAITGDAENFRAVAGLSGLLNPLNQVAFFVGMVAISGFFAAIWTKIHTASTADARRRLVLLVNGTSLALTPLFVVVLYGLFHRGFDDIPEAVWVPCILMLALFPITLAYTIVVQRALDVRVVIRQGLRYALARRGILVVQFIALGAVTLSAATLMTDPGRNRPRKLQVLALGMIAGLGIRRAGDKLQGWTDRRFFREAYNAEQILSELSDQVRTMVEMHPLLETVAQSIAGSLHVPRVAMLVKANGCYEAAYAIGYPAPPHINFEESAGTVAVLKRSREPLRVYFDDPDSWIFREESVTEAERDELRKLESQLLLPLAFKEKLVGFMSLSAKKSEEPYSRSDVQLLGSVATQTGLALENSQLTEAIAVEVAHRERLNRELEIAREVQERLFPQSHPAVAGLDYGGRCRPAQGVGGDYYDFLELADGSFGIAIGDVSGKGFPAALLMASLQAGLRGQTISAAPDLAKLMSNLNRLIFEATPSNRYATFFYGQYEPAGRKFTFVNAGHNAPMVFRNGEIIRLEDGGPVIGLFKAARYTQACAQLARGDVMVLFTDGISEAMNAVDDEWGEERLMDAVNACKQRPAIEMIDCLMRDADAFVAGAPQHDDMTIMVVKLV